MINAYRLAHSTAVLENLVRNCFTDHRDPDLIEHSVYELIAQRVYALCLGYEDLNDHDQLRHDPVQALLAEKLAASRADCAPVATVARDARFSSHTRQRMTTAIRIETTVARP